MVREVMARVGENVGCGGERILLLFRTSRNCHPSGRPRDQSLHCGGMFARAESACHLFYPNDADCSYHDQQGDGDNHNSPLH